MPLFALISVHSGWRIGYGLVAILAVTSGLLIWFRLPPGIVGERRSISERLAVLRVPGVRVVLFTGLLFGVGAFLPNVYVAVVSINSMGMDVGAVPLALLAMGVGAVIGGIAAGQMIDRLGAYRTFLLFAVTTTVLLLLIPVLPLLPSPLIAPLWLLVLALLGLVAWALFAALVNILAAFAPTEVPLVISLNLTAGSFGGAVAAFLGGIAAERFGAASIGLLGAAFTIAALGLALANRRTLRNPG
jgi:predicted MFS family arabinose efflux permease